MTDLISIIVPVYKVEQYLPRCIASLVGQTYKNIEIILVDDGSPDKCGEICDEYAKKDKRIKVIHKANGGLSSARNAGLDIAIGKYICFVDSDDYLMENYIERLHKSITENNADIAQCEFIETSDDEVVLTKENFVETVFNGEEMIGKIYDYYGIYVSTIVVWTKIYKKELFENIRFPIGRIHEDEATTYKLFYKAKKVAVTNEKLYCYFKADGSITRSGFSVKKIDYLRAVEERAEFFKEKGLIEFYIRDIKNYMVTSVKYSMKISDKKIKKELMEKSHEYYKKIMELDIPVKTKIRYTLYRIHPIFIKILEKR